MFLSYRGSSSLFLQMGKLRLQYVIICPRSYGINCSLSASCLSLYPAWVHLPCTSQLAAADKCAMQTVQFISLVCVCLSVFNSHGTFHEVKVSVCRSFENPTVAKVNTKSYTYFSFPSCRMELANSWCNHLVLWRDERFRGDVKSGEMVPERIKTLLKEVSDCYNWIYTSISSGFKKEWN